MALGSIKKPVTAAQVQQRNSAASMPRTGAIIPFLSYFKPSSSAAAAAPPASWLTRR
jgi:hypothetical protein